MPSPTLRTAPCSPPLRRRSSATPPQQRLHAIIFDETASNQGSHMKNKPDPTIEEINKNFKVDDDGIVYRIVRHSSMQPGTRASFVRDQTIPYLYVMLNGIRFRAHRICWIWYNQAEIPCGMEVDHINRIPSDNRKENLRVVEGRENQRNRSDNKSGYPGVSERKGKGTWRACICTNRKKTHLGTFQTKEEANQAYLNALNSL